MSKEKKTVGMASTIISNNIIFDIMDRKGLGDVWNSIDDNTQEEIQNTWKGIIKKEIESI